MGIVLDAYSVIAGHRNMKECVYFCHKQRAFKFGNLQYLRNYLDQRPFLTQCSPIISLVLVQKHICLCLAWGYTAPDEWWGNWHVPEDHDVVNMYDTCIVLSLPFRLISMALWNICEALLRLIGIRVHLNRPQWQTNNGLLLLVNKIVYLFGGARNLSFKYTFGLNNINWKSIL